MKNRKNQALITTLIIGGIMISYMMQMGPSPMLLLLQDEFQLQGKDVILNLCVSVIFPLIIIGSVAGGYLIERIGTSRLFILTMSLLTVGIIGNFWVTNIAVFLLFRAVFGLGFGLGIPFIGSAIMIWYNPKQREAMTTVNGLFPFVATLLTYSLMLPLARLFNNSWKAALGCWGVFAAITTIAWIFAVHKPMGVIDAENNHTKLEKGLYKGLLRRKSIRILVVVFICDFFCYSYIATILPTWLYESGGFSEVTSNIMAAIAFPLLGLLGCVAGGVYSAKTRSRKPPLVIGQVLKLIGLIAASLSSQLWGVILGVSVYAFGNGLWMPSMYGIPTELDQMNATRVGAAFTLMSSFGFAVGFFSPVIGGYLTMEIPKAFGMGAMTAHVFGLRWSVFIFSFFNLAAFISAMRLTEPCVNKCEELKQCR